MDHHASDVITTDPPTVGQLYTTEETAKLLRVSQRTVQVWISERDVPEPSAMGGSCAFASPIWMPLASTLCPGAPPRPTPRTYAPCQKRLAQRRSDLMDIVACMEHLAVSLAVLHEKITDSSWVGARRGPLRHVSSRPPFSTGRAAFTASGAAP